ncbi:MAG: sigma-70 family RNA polymerase sigma factor [Microlunatus sp.]|nr:sigma-70 family RNA polymerase sigma factor [Microlunatus sp.]MDN5771450.1 sigma-70 family RNA polymerase sigma factor [Microlunatus sp.]MDN5805004.1 sigma-70 family RNA polymerase sigma factor [Microlunatus sp.]
MTGTKEDGLAARAGRMFSAYRDGDEAKMADLVRILTPILWHTVRGVRLDPATAEDVVQSVWLTLVRKAETISEPQAVLQWLVVTARREAWRVAKATTKMRPEDLESAVGSDQLPSRESVEDDVVTADTQSRLWRHIQKLPDRCQALLRVIAFADRPDYAELARSLGMPQGSIGPTRGRCLAKLRLALTNDPGWEAR